jgi:hypothetical protein
MTEFTVHATRSDQANDPCFYVPSGIPSGTTRVDATMSNDKAEDCIIDLGILDVRAADYPMVKPAPKWSHPSGDQ